MTNNLSPESREQLAQFCTGWLLEFGDRPVNWDEWSNSLWYNTVAMGLVSGEECQKWLNQRVHPLLSPVPGTDGWQLNERAWALIKGEYKEDV